MADSMATPDHNAVNYRNTAALLLPAEIWLQILEHNDPKHLWLSVRTVSRTHQDLVERLFTSTYLQRLTIALSLPRRDPATSKLKWPGDPLPGAQMVMRYARLGDDKSKVRLESPVLVRDWRGEMTLELLRETGVLPKQRLEEAPANVNMSRHTMAGVAVDLPVRVEWDDGLKVWVWEVEWRGLLSRFFEAKERQGKRWPTTASTAGPQTSRWRSRRG